jgi:hypothetical protein
LSLGSALSAASRRGIACSSGSGVAVGDGVGVGVGVAGAPFAPATPGTVAIAAKQATAEKTRAGKEAEFHQA